MFYFLISLFLSCSDPSTLNLTEELNITVEQNPSLPTSLIVSWETDKTGTSWVEYHVSGEVYSTPISELSNEFSFILMGLPSLSEIQIHAHTQADLIEYEGMVVADTGAVPDQMPSFHINSSNEELWEDYPFVLVLLRERDNNWAEIITRTGETVWFLEGEVKQEFADGEVDYVSGEFVFLQQDWFGENGSILRIIPTDPTDYKKYSTPEAHHGLALLPNGYVAFISSDTRSWGGVETIGDKIVILAPDGSTEDLFSVWDWREPGFQAGDFTELIMDWTHANSLQYRASTKSLLLSLRNYATVLEIDAFTGDVIKEYGACYQPGSNTFFYQHDVTWTSDNSLLMVSTPRRSDGLLTNSTEAIEYNVKDDGCLEQIWSYRSDDPIKADTHGGAHRLKNGNTLINWGEPTGIIREVSSSGQNVWEARAFGPEETSTTVFATIPFYSFYEVSQPD